MARGDRKLPSDDLARESWRLVRDLLGVESPRLKAIADEFGLAPPHVIALRHVADGPARSIGEIGAAMHADKSTMTWIADQLEQRGLAERRDHPRDRRAKLLVPTDEGRRVNRQIEARVSEPPTALARLPEVEQKALHRALERAVEAARPAQRSNP